MFELGGPQGTVEAGDVDRPEGIPRFGHQVLLQSPVRPHKQNLPPGVPLLHQLRQGDGGIHVSRSAAAGENNPFNGLSHTLHLIFCLFRPGRKKRGGRAYPALVGFICLETDSTIPISANWIERAVPP